MKRINKILLVLVVVSSSFAFAKATQQSKLVDVLWEYTSNSTSATDENNPDNYHQFNADNPDYSCNNGSVICRISALADANGKPVIPTAGAQSIKVSSRTAQ